MYQPTYVETENVNPEKSSRNLVLAKKTREIFGKDASVLGLDALHLGTTTALRKRGITNITLAELNEDTASSHRRAGINVVEKDYVEAAIEMAEEKKFFSTYDFDGQSVYNNSRFAELAQILDKSHPGKFILAGTFSLGKWTRREDKLGRLRKRKADFKSTKKDFDADLPKGFKVRMFKKYQRGPLTRHMVKAIVTRGI